MIVSRAVFEFKIVTDKAKGKSQKIKSEKWRFTKGGGT